mmetsp:Transcript_30368/g.55033  ORF Transcript_30368/g.55033 Transcript_30368/m.55033 type:complete len:211 (-) Transcript_30368:1084-1716(-)
MFARTQHEVVEQLGREVGDVGFVDEVVDEFEGALADADVGILEAVDDGGAMALEGGGGRVGMVVSAFLSSGSSSCGLSILDALRTVGNALCQRIQRHIPYIIIAIQQKPPQNIDRQHPQTIIALHRHNRLHALVQNGIPRILAGLRIRRHLRQHIVHLLRGLDIPRPQQPQQRQQLDLQKRIGNATDIVIGGVSHGKQIAEEFDKGGDEA